MLRLVVAASTLVGSTTAWQLGVPGLATRGVNRGASVHMVSSWYDSGARLSGGEAEEVAVAAAAAEQAPAAAAEPPKPDLVALERAKRRAMREAKAKERADWSSRASFSTRGETYGRSMPLGGEVLISQEAIESAAAAALSAAEESPAADAASEEAAAGDTPAARRRSTFRAVAEERDDWKFRAQNGLSLGGD